jgi:hypothetical protein
MTTFNPTERIVWGLSLMLAPLCMAASTFFWVDGEYDPTGGALQVVSTVFWIPTFMVLFGSLKEKMPRYAVLGFLVAVYGCIGGSNFGMRGLFASAFDVSHRAVLEQSAVHPLPFNLTLYWAGPLFPLSLLVLGINLIRYKVVPVQTGVFVCLGGLLFPLSRISRIEVVAHLADLILLIPFVFLGLKILGKKVVFEPHTPEI